MGGNAVPPVLFRHGERSSFEHRHLGVVNWFVRRRPAVRQTSAFDAAHDASTPTCDIHSGLRRHHVAYVRRVELHRSHVRGDFRHRRGSGARRQSVLPARRRACATETPSRNVFMAEHLHEHRLCRRGVFRRNLGRNMWMGCGIRPSQRMRPCIVSRMLRPCRHLQKASIGLIVTKIYYAIWAANWHGNEPQRKPHCVDLGS